MFRLSLSGSLKEEEAKKSEAAAREIRIRRMEQELVLRSPRAELCCLWELEDGEDSQMVQ
jgi:hypothetical protein